MTTKTKRVKATWRTPDEGEDAMLENHSYAVEYYCGGRWERLMNLASTMATARVSAESHFSDVDTRPKMRIVRLGIEEVILVAPVGKGIIPV